MLKSRRLRAYELNVQSYARRNQHQQVVEVILLARVRLLFHHRRWDLIAQSLHELGEACHWSDSAGFKSRALDGPNSQWSTTVAVHFLLFRCLWEGRVGRPQLVRRFRKEAFHLMDEAAERGAFAVARGIGGLQKVSAYLPWKF